MWIVEVKETNGYREIFVQDSELEMLRTILYSCITETVKIHEVDLIEREYKFNCLLNNAEVMIDVYKKELNPQFIG